MSCMADELERTTMEALLRGDAPPADDGQPRKRKYVNHQKLELDYLRKKVEEMEKQMAILGSMQTETVLAGAQWQDMAKDQQLQMQLAIMENARLKAALQDELAFAETLAGIVQKRPKVLQLPTTKDSNWQEFKLVADATERAAAFTAIADREYNKVLNLYLQRQLHETHTVKSTTVKYLDDGVRPGIVIESFNRLAFAHVPFRMLGHAIWSFLNADHVNDAANGSDSFENLGSPEDNMVYMKSRWQISPGTVAESRLVIKRFIEETREIVVWRNIIEDALLPFDPLAITFNGSGWAIVEQTADNGSTLQFFTEISTPLTQTPPLLASPSPDELLLENVLAPEPALSASMLAVPRMETDVGDNYQVGAFTDSILSAYRNAYRRFEAASMRLLSNMQHEDLLLSSLDQIVELVDFHQKPPSAS
ncbi:hypothetical protein SPRG_16369 [Saprolegnia parasitica CBS 223.65]|uniref:START domain-containing protein n=1 Tax=Saprolegnia parasitica (strain CBS 223.65) TaxID=695850 RepID=A0A067BJB9_SAPPC|nr:hypothetical protein SPRG_16369 [Saprolegnia parasitica CBS 223.65]KDO18248.1 hypothetical protein SPRG_16369 [Saprolegnia parasitica CBS 223.65]|eukprot:XP_012211042.1 hypothetical protein SPRG_16369 [Saprolegnia parasitica CBS 223.65]